MDELKYKAKHVRTGIYGEKYVMELLDGQGYEVTPPESAFCGDLSVFDGVNGQHYRLEVKTANKGIDGCFSFCVMKTGKTDISHSDVVALVFKHKRKTIVRFIAVKHLKGIKKLKISSVPDEYNGKYKKLWSESLQDVAL